MRKPILFLLFFPVWLVSCEFRNNSPEITVPELKDHVEYLASSRLEGRFPGTDGDIQAGRYIRDRFSSAGLDLKGEDGFQYFDFLLNKQAGPNSFISVEGYTAVQGSDFKPALSASGDTLDAGLVFAGYGFDLLNKGIEWNDYKDLAVEGKWVLILCGDPEPDNPASIYAGISGEYEKLVMARDKGAAGVLFVCPDLNEIPDKEYERSSGAGIPAFYLSEDMGNRLFGAASDSIGKLRERINQSRQACSFPVSTQIRGHADILENNIETANIVAYLEGNDPVRKKDILLIGAHYDHLGHGGPGSGSRAPDSSDIHPGADDNASGISGLIELAEKFSAVRDSLHISLLFVAFGAEEEGLIGSRYFMEQDMIPGSRYLGMINLDMIGRLKEDRSIQIGGSGTAEEIPALLEEAAKNSTLVPATTPEGYGPSDHASFYAKDIPVFFFSTGAHLDYHTPADQPDKINYEGMKEIAGFVYKLGMLLNDLPGPLHFREAGPRSFSGSHRSRGGVSLGIMPDYAGLEKNGLRADFVIEGRPAALAGMKDGDLIVSINGLRVTNIDDYMVRLSQLRHGQTVNVEVLREGSSLLLLVQL